MLNQKNYIYKFDLSGNFLEKFDSAINAANSENIKYTCIIYESCRNKRASHGFIWLEEDDVIFDNNSYIIPNFNIRDYMKISKEIYVFDKTGNFIDKYKSITEASKKTGMNRHSIRNILSGDTKPRKFIFKYAEDVIESENISDSFLIKTSS